MSIPNDLLEQVRSLDEEDQTELAYQLLMNLSPEGPERDPAWERAWAEEIERRAQEIDEGRATLLTWEEVRATFRKPTIPGAQR